MSDGDMAPGTVALSGLVVGAGAAWDAYLSQHKPGCRAQSVTIVVAPSRGRRGDTMSN